MKNPKVYFGERVAASYDDLYGRTFQPEAVDPPVSLLAELIKRFAKRPAV